MKIPRSFSMGCHLWRVSIVSLKTMERLTADMEPDVTPYGMTDVYSCKVYIRKDVCPSMQWHAFWHEYMHVLMDAAGLPKIDADEEKIDLLGLLTAQAMQTMK